MLWLLAGVWLDDEGLIRAQLTANNAVSKIRPNSFRIAGKGYNDHLRLLNFSENNLKNRLSVQETGE